MDSNNPLYCIKNFLNPDNCLQESVPVVNYGCSCLLLEEPKNQGEEGTLEKFRLMDVPDGVIAYAIDNALEKPYPAPRGKNKYRKVFSNLIKQIENVHSPCDYVIFFIKNDKIHVVLCEMKSKKIIDCTPKIKATRCFIDYLRLLITNFEEPCPQCFKHGFTYSNIRVDLVSDTSLGTPSNNGTHPSAHKFFEKTTTTENKIYHCPLGNQPIRDGAFEVSWASFLQQARIDS